jgi:hypothetical protein
MAKGNNRKNIAYKVMHQKHHARNALKNYQEKRKNEISYTKKRKEELKELHGINEVRNFYRMISEARKGFTQ